MGGRGRGGGRGEIPVPPCFVFSFHSSLFFVIFFLFFSFLSVEGSCDFIFLVVLLFFVVFDGFVFFVIVGLFVDVDFIFFHLWMYFFLLFSICD